MIILNNIAVTTANITFHINSWMEEAIGPDMIRSCSEFTNFRRKITTIVPMVSRCFSLIACFVSIRVFINKSVK